MLGSAIIIYNITSRWAHFTHPPAACDLDIFHYITAYINAIEALVVDMVM